MDLENASTIGVALLITLALLSAYLMLLKIRESFLEKPDPKLTYLSKTEFEAYMTHSRQELETLKKVFYTHAEQTAALIAQMQLVLQRVGELTTKLDRIQERTRV